MGKILPCMCDSIADRSFIHTLGSRPTPDGKRMKGRRMKKTNKNEKVGIAAVVALINKKKNEKNPTTG
jgi:hypothetical protein